MAVNDESVIPIDELVTLESVSGERLVISPPNAHTGARPVRVRIMSYSHRRDLVNLFSNDQRIIMLGGVCSELKVLRN